MAQSKSVRLVTESALDVSNAGLKASVAADLAPVKTDVAALKVIGGLAPGSVNDATSANLLKTPTTETAKALAAAIGEQTEWSDTGYTGSPKVIQAPTLQPADSDARQLARPAIPNAPVIDKPTVVGARRNLWYYTENLSGIQYTAGTATKQTDTITTGEGVTLTRVTSSGYFSGLVSPMGNLGPLNLFTIGNYYLVSYYVAVRSKTERFFWMRNVASTRGHGARMVEPGKAQRVWKVCKATSANHLADINGSPSAGYDAAPGYHPTWFQQGRQEEGDSLTVDWYFGGFQIENLGAAVPKAGIAVIGDSTIQGAAGSTDTPAAREMVNYLGALLNVDAFNRGVGGNTLLQMDARWATDITPLAAVSKYVVIQGGINDINQGRTLADMQANASSMATKAATDGLIPVMLTVTPSNYSGVDPVKEQKRLDYNAWLHTTFPRVIDIAPVVADPLDTKFLRRTPGGSTGWYGDGVHYSRAAKRAVAERLAAWSGWEFPTPTAYQKVAGATFTPEGAIVLVSPDGTRYKLSVANGGGLTATPV